jgi:predicted KAP-like P-loop ATPase
MIDQISESSESFSSDQPITCKDDDQLGRAKFSLDLAKGIKNWLKDQDSYVIALYGKWGSGKTSVINMVKDELEKSKESSKKFNNFKIFILIIINIITLFIGWHFIEFLGRIINFFNYNFLQFIVILHYFLRILLTAILVVYINKISERILKLNFFQSKFNKLKNWFKELFIKTTKINIVKNWFKESFIKTPKTNIEIIEPNPWMYANLNNLTINFLREFGKQLNLKDNSKINRKLANLLDDYRRILTSLDINSSLILKGITKILRINQHEKSAKEIKEEIKKTIIKYNKKILIIIDDIDRLNVEETLELFRLIRINADFPNTIYLLSFDKDIVEKKLQYKFQDKNYLEKIVQLPFNIPEVKENRIHDYLKKEINKIFDQYRSTANLNELLGNKDQYFQEIFDSGFKDLFKNLREVKRFVNIFKFSISLIVKEDDFEANPVDLMAIEAIRYFANEFYDFIKNNDRVVNHIGLYYGEGIDEGKEEFKLKLDNNFKNIKEEYRDKIMNLSIELFPNIDYYLKLNPSYDNNNAEIAHELVKNKANYLCICDPEHFNRYFTLNPDDIELTEREFSKILNLINSDDEIEFEQLILEYNNNEKMDLIIDKIQKNPKKIKPEKVEKILIVFINLQYDLSTLFVAVYPLLELNKDEDNFEIYQNIIYKINDISKLVVILEKYNIFQDSLKTSNSNNEHEQSQKLFRKRLNNSLLNIINNQKLSLLDQKDLLRILYYWHANDPVKYQEFIDNALKEDNFFLKLIEGFIREEDHVKLSIDDNESTSKKIKYFNFEKEAIDHIKEKFSLEPLQIKNRIEAIKNNNPQLYQQHQETCNIFIKSF